MANRDLIKLEEQTEVRLRRGGMGDGFTPQSLALISANQRIVLCSGSSPNHILKCDSVSYKDMGAIPYIGHANGGTYCSKNGLIYATAYEGSSNRNKIKAIDSKTYRVQFTVSLPVSATGIAYDKSVNKFYISSGSKIYVFPYSDFASGGTASSNYTSFTKNWTNDGRDNQDIGGHNGVVMVCRSFGDGSYDADQKSYIDCYDSSDGTYLKSYWYDYGELESCAVDSSGYIHVLFAQYRALIKTKNKFTLSGKGKKTTTKKKVVKKYEGNIVVEKAKSYVGQGGSHFWNYAGFKSDWCVMFVKCIFSECNLTGRLPTKGSWVVDTFFNELKDKGAKVVTVANSKPGDIIFYNTSQYRWAHVEIVTESGNAKSCGGNTGSENYAYSKVQNRRNTMSVTSVLRPPYENVVVSEEEYESEEYVEGNRLVTNPDKLYSSDNYGYLEHKERTKVSEEYKSDIKKIIDNATNFVPLDTKANIDILTSSPDNSRLPKTKVYGEEYGPSLPVSLNPVEAPFVELTIGGITFGSYDSKNPRDKYPNYIDGLSVIRTNGSMNEYTIDLVHQIRPVSNPNYIDELLSKNGYDKIKIKYGDANSGVIFTDDSALLIGSNINFDFISCNIKYTIKATSSAMSIASHKRTFASIEDKPSNIIRNLLYGDSYGDLVEAFPDMKDRNYVETNGLIPTNDKVTAIDEYKDINIVTYLKNLVASMSSLTSTNSTYYLLIESNKFRIVELEAGNFAYNSLLYEVDINYIDKNQVFDFTVDTDFAWPLVYNYSTNISNYNYEYSNKGDVLTFPTNSSNLVDYSSMAQYNLNTSWWTDVTDFPITAKLQCRGLLSPLLLLTYIKINCLYYGNKRLTSGIYIVTGQQDILNKSGYRTILSLTRVSGPNQHLTVDGRVTT